MFKIVVVFLLILITSGKDGGFYLLQGTVASICFTESTEESNSTEENEVREYSYVIEAKRNFEVAATKVIAVFSNFKLIILSFLFYFSFFSFPPLYILHRAILI